MTEQELKQDREFMAAKPEDQHAYLLETDPDYKKASPEQQRAYMRSLVGMPDGPGPAHNPQPQPEHKPTFQERVGDLIPESAMPVLGAINKYAVQPFEKMSSYGAEKGADLAEAVVTAPQKATEYLIGSGVTEQDR